MREFLCHDVLWVRFISYISALALLFLIVWTVSFYFLPEGIIRGKTATVIVGNQAAGNFYREFLRIAVYNLIISMGLVIAANWVFRVGCYPLGYLLPIYFTVLYAITLGTNSFAIPLPERIMPTLAVFKRSGVYEIVAFAMMATATHGISAYRVKRFIPPDSEEIIPKPSILRNTDWVGFVIAVSLLLAANAWEAYQIVYLV